MLNRGFFTSVSIQLRKIYMLFFEIKFPSPLTKLIWKSRIGEGLKCKSRTTRLHFFESAILVIARGILAVRHSTNQWCAMLSGNPPISMILCSVLLNLLWICFDKNKVSIVWSFSSYFVWLRFNHTYIRYFYTVGLMYILFLYYTFVWHCWFFDSFACVSQGLGTVKAII